MTKTALPAFRWLPSMVILVPPDRGPVDGCTRVKYGDWKDRSISGGRKEKNGNRGVWRPTSPADHEGEGLGGDGLVVLMDAVPHAHLHLGLLHPVTRGVVQPTHDPAKRGGAEMSIRVWGERSRGGEGAEPQHLHRGDPRA